MKVTAVDPITGMEAAVTFPARGYSDPYMKQAAARLLTRRIKAAYSDESSDDPPTPRNGGIIV